MKKWIDESLLYNHFCFKFVLVQITKSHSLISSAMESISIKIKQVTI